MVSFVLAGAAKAGTSSVFRHLDDHPQIFMSAIKEPKFFQWDGEDFRYSTELDERIYKNSIKSFSKYQELFAGADANMLTGEASASYLYHPRVAQRLNARFPESKILILLRQPADRAFSHYLHTKRLGYEPLSFERALEAEPGRIEAKWGPSWHYASQGYYSSQVKRCIDVFGPERVQITVFENFVADPSSSMQEIFSFLGVSSDAPSPNLGAIQNEGGLPLIKSFQRLVDQPNILKDVAKRVLPRRIRRQAISRLRELNRYKPKIDPVTRRRLTEIYLPDIRCLEALVQRDLSHWYS